MKPTMIVVADSARARIFTADSASSPLNEIETMAHPEGRMHDREITSDLPGKGVGGDGSCRNVENPRQLFPGDFIHIRNHQQQSLGCGEGCG